MTWGSLSDQKGLLKGKTLKRLGKGLLLQLTDCSGKQHKTNVWKRSDEYWRYSETVWMRSCVTGLASAGGVGPDDLQKSLHAYLLVSCSVCTDCWVPEQVSPWRTLFNLGILSLILILPDQKIPSGIFCLILHEIFTQNYLLQHTTLNKGTRGTLIFMVSGVTEVINCGYDSRKI